MYRRMAVMCAGAVALAGCYHVTVVTGAPDGSTRIEEPWQMAWVYGLVPPEEIQADQTCSGGVARVETERSFLNGLVANLSFGIFTPLNVTVTCQAGGQAPQTGAQSDGAASSSSAPEPVDGDGRVIDQRVVNREP